MGIRDRMDELEETVKDLRWLNDKAAVSQGDLRRKLEEKLGNLAQRVEALENGFSIPIDGLPEGATVDSVACTVNYREAAPPCELVDDRLSRAKFVEAGPGTGGYVDPSLTAMESLAKEARRAAENLQQWAADVAGGGDGKPQPLGRDRNGTPVWEGDRVCNPTHDSHFHTFSAKEWWDMAKHSKAMVEGYALWECGPNHPEEAVR